MEAIIIACIGAVSGLSATVFSFVTFLIQRDDKKKKKNSAEADMLLGLGHDRIIFLGTQYIKSVNIMIPTPQHSLRPYTAVRLILLAEKQNLNGDILPNTTAKR